MVLALAILAAGAYGLSRTIDRSTSVEEVTNSAASSTAGYPSKMTFSDIAKEKGSYECSINQTKNGVATQGTVFMDNGRIRGDAIVQSPSGKVTASLIIRDNTVYYWNSILPSGIKLSYKTPEYKEGDFSQFDEGGVYDCKPWKADESKFNVPKNINFQAM